MRKSTHLSTSMASPRGRQTGYHGTFKEKYAAWLLDHSPLPPPSPSPRPPPRAFKWRADESYSYDEEIPAAPTEDNTTQFDDGYDFLACNLGPRFIIPRTWDTGELIEVRCPCW